MKKILLIACICSSLLWTSCDNYLDVEPFSAIDEEGAITSVDNATAALTGVYDAIQNFAVSCYGRDFVIYGDVFTNNIEVSPNNSNRFLAEARWQMNATNVDTQNTWRYYYRAINAANNILNAASISGDKAMVDQIKGEAYALRALCYFDLVRLFAQPYDFTSDASHYGVPYITEHNPKGQPGRNTVKEVYTGILSDLTQAETLMTENATKTRLQAPFTFSVLGAKALKSRVFLYQGNYNDSRDYAESVIQSGKYTLTSNANYLTSLFLTSRSESIFTIAYSKTDYLGTNSLGYIYVPGGYRDLLANSNLVSLYDNDDVRKKWFSSATIAGQAVTVVSAKYPGREAAPGLDNYDVIRLSEVYLIAAEANVKATNPNAARAQELVTAIRQRALPSASAVTATGQELLNEIYLEKRKELAFEGHYFHDLKRLGLPITGAKYGAATPVVVLKGDDMLAMPIPQVEIDANPTLKPQQNPGY